MWKCVKMNVWRVQIFSMVVVVSSVVSQLILPDLMRINEQSIPEDGRLDFQQLAEKYGRPAEEHRVTTEDGYVLTMFHIPGARGPVLLQHGLIDSADTFIIRGNNSLAFKMAEAGYDVWLGNARGNKYSRRHATLDPNSDKQFWNFSMHEIGYYDLPAMIDFVLLQTHASQLVAVGHSQGNAIFYVLGSTRPEYNEKVKLLLALAPVCFLSNVRPPISALIAVSPVINDLLISIGQEELLSDQSALKSLIRLVCATIPFNYDICATGGFLFFAGSDPKEFEKEFLDVVIWHYPTGTSRKNALHLSQIARSKQFQQFNHGTEKNLQVYGSPSPPLYDLNLVTMKIQLFSGANDKLSTLEDVVLLKKRLPNASYHLIDHKRMNHLDFVWGKHMDIYLYPLLFKVLQKYGC